MKRSNNRKASELRPLKIERRYTKYAPGSVLISFGDTKVLCTATIEEKVPLFLRDKKEGWLTAEYSLLPSATHTRVGREVSKGKPSGRTSEIQRLIGRALRSVVDMKLLGERTIYIDCDVIQADGGTRTASITGGMIALKDAIDYLLSQKLIKKSPLKEYLSAISVGVVKGEVMLDLSYEEDSACHVDMNVVMTESGKFIEIQGTAEHAPFSDKELTKMLDLAKSGIKTIISEIK